MSYRRIIELADQEGNDMTTKRQMRASKNRIPSNITAEYLGGLCFDVFLEEGKSSPHSKFTPDERDLVREYEKCGRDFEKWREFRQRKIEIQNARKLKRKKIILNK